MKRIFVLTLMAALSLGAAGVAPGETRDATRQEVQTGPSPEMKKLEFLVGKCAGSGKIYMPGQGSMEWSGSDTTTWMKGGSYLKSESKITYPGVGVDEGLTMMAYDHQAKLYRLWRYSSFTTVPIEATGNFEGEKLVMVTKPCEKGLVFRITFEPKAKREVTFLLELKNGDNYEKFQEGVFTIRS